VISSFLLDRLLKYESDLVLPTTEGDDILSWDDDIGLPNLVGAVWFGSFVLGKKIPVIKK
jgi:hypothetical protein